MQTINGKTELQVCVFAESEVQDIMRSCDMTDNNTKIFGSFSAYKMTTSAEVTNEYKEEMVRHLLGMDELAFVLVEDRFGFRKNITSLSNGQNFLWVSDFKQGLIDQGAKEIS